MAGLCSKERQEADFHHCAANIANDPGRRVSFSSGVSHLLGVSSHAEHQHISQKLCAYRPIGVAASPPTPAG